MPTETEVLIVGAGPTGLMAALGLADHGVRCRLIDRVPVRSDKSRALVVHARTLEIFDRFGCSAPLIEQGRTVIHARWHIGEHPPLNIEFNDIGVEDTPYPFMLFVSQADTERAMEAAVRKLGVEVERPVELVSFTQDDAGVLATLRSASGAEEVVRAKYLVGADGAHSAVRKGLALRFDGAPYQHNFVLADCEVDWADGELGILRAFVRPQGLAVAFPFGQGHRYRIIAAEPSAGAPPEGDPTLEEVESMARRLITVPLTIRDPHWLARFHLHHRGVDHYRVGRAFVAGDAAHIHSPLGGQGMNTGIQDAANLAWKLAAVIQGHAGPRLLDSYEEERLPVGRQLLKITDQMFSLATSTNNVIVGLRELLLPHVMPFATATRERRAKVFRRVAEIDIHYRGSSIVGEHDSGFSGGARPGERAPDGPVRLANGGASTLHKQLTRFRHDLVLVDPPAGTAATFVPPWVNVVTVEGDPALRARLGSSKPAMYLVRPDGYIAMRSTEIGPQAFEHFLQRAYARA